MDLSTFCSLVPTLDEETREVGERATRFVSKPTTSLKILPPYSCKFNYNVSSYFINSVDFKFFSFSARFSLFD